MAAVSINSDRLRRELLRRGWSGADLSRRTGISKPTISCAMRGRPIQPRTLKRIARALSETQAIDGADDLM